MFFSLVFSLCAGASAPVGAPCDEWVISQHQTLKQCITAMDAKIATAEKLFKDDPNWVISCEKTTIKRK